MQIPARSTLLASMLLLSTSLLARPVTATEPAPKKVVKVRYLTSRIWQGEDAGSYAKLIESTYAPDGWRAESARGNTTIQDQKKQVYYMLNTETRVAQCFDARPDKRPETKA